MRKIPYLCIALSVLIISTSFLYRYVFYLPKRETENQKLENQIKCKQEGMKMFEKDKNEDTDPGIPITWFEPKFVFVSNNVCYYKGGYRMSNIEMNYIYDVYKNKEEASFTISRINNKIEYTGDKEYYDVLNSEYFK
jgi:hypothetical protein